MNPRPTLSRALICAAWLLAHSASADCRFDVWTTDSGLPQNFIGRIVQTRDGYLWMTTLDGLVQFDGVRFTVFNKGNSPGFPGNRHLDARVSRTLWLFDLELQSAFGAEQLLDDVARGLTGFPDSLRR